MNYYTSTIPLTLAEKLKERGMSIKITRQTFAIDDKYEYETKTTYAEVFDWLIEKGQIVYITRVKITIKLWQGRVNENVNSKYYSTWHEAANAAIEKALTLI